MARTTDVLTLTGMDSFQRALKEAPARTIDRTADAIAATTHAITGRARSMAPSATGALKRSIVGTATGLNGRVGIDGVAYYWRFVEYGTVRMAAQPFVRPAVEAETLPFEQRLKTIASDMERDFSGGRFT